MVLSKAHNKAAHRDGLRLTSFAVMAAHGLNRYTF